MSLKHLMPLGYTIIQVTAVMKNVGYCIIIIYNDIILAQTSLSATLQLAYTQLEAPGFNCSQCKYSTLLCKRRRLNRNKLGLFICRLDSFSGVCVCFLQDGNEHSCMCTRPKLLLLGPKSIARDPISPHGLFVHPISQYSNHIVRFCVPKCEFTLLTYQLELIELISHVCAYFSLGTKALKQQCTR